MVWRALCSRQGEEKVPDTVAMLLRLLLDFGISEALSAAVLTGGVLAGQLEAVLDVGSLHAKDSGACACALSWPGLLPSRVRRRPSGRHLGVLWEHASAVESPGRGGLVVSAGASEGIFLHAEAKHSTFSPSTPVRGVRLQLAQGSLFFLVKGSSMIINP